MVMVAGGAVCAIVFVQKVVKDISLLPRQQHPHARTLLFLPPHIHLLLHLLRLLLHRPLLLLLINLKAFKITRPFRILFHGVWKLFESEQRTRRSFGSSGAAVAIKEGFTMRKATYQLVLNILEGLDNVRIEM